MCPYVRIQACYQKDSTRQDWSSFPGNVGEQRVLPPPVGTTIKFRVTLVLVWLGCMHVCIPAHTKRIRLVRETLPRTHSWRIERSLHIKCSPHRSTCGDGAGGCFNAWASRDSPSSDSEMETPSLCRTKPLPLDSMDEPCRENAAVLHRVL
jgi:hypothetical protein